MNKIINGDSKEVLKEFKDNSFHAVITDPPYGINIRGQKWDESLPDLEIWKECYRVLKPGGMILAFADSRNYHHLAVDLEKVGFNTYPLFCWIYPDGFPKGMNLSKEIDKELLRSTPTEEFRDYLRQKMTDKAISGAQIEKQLKIRGMFSHYLGVSQPQYPSPYIWEKLKNILDLDERFDKEIHFGRNQRHLELVSSSNSYKYLKDNYQGYFPKTDEAKRWKGYRYGARSIRPALTPIYVGQKPFCGKFTKNFLKYNTGAINTNEDKYPSNVFIQNIPLAKEAKYFNKVNTDNYIYSSKSVKKEKGEFNNHPTVKPIDLMRQLIKLAVPENGQVLDPFLGSGTTALASYLQGIHFVGIEKEEEYFRIAKQRLEELKSNCGDACA